MSWDWKKWKIGFPYKGINDPKYIAEKEKTFNKNGNGWWWEWSKLNTPLPGVYSVRDNRSCNDGKGLKKAGRPPKEDFDDPKNK